MSAGLADCHGANSASASRIRAKGTLLRGLAPVFRGLGRLASPNYRARMKDLRRADFAPQQSWGMHDRLRPPCDATRLADILRFWTKGTPAEDVLFHGEYPMNPPVSAPAIKVVKSVREQVSPEEWD